MQLNQTHFFNTIHCVTDCSDNGSIYWIYCHLSPMPHTGYNVLTHLCPDCSEFELHTIMLSIQALPIQSPTEPKQWDGADVLGLCQQPEDPEEAATQGGAEKEGGGRPCSSHQGVLEDCKEMTVFMSTSHHNCCTHLPCTNYESNWTRLPNYLYNLLITFTPDADSFKPDYISLSTMGWWYNVLSKWLSRENTIQYYLWLNSQLWTHFRWLATQFKL